MTLQFVTLHPETSNLALSRCIELSGFQHEKGHAAFENVSLNDFQQDRESVAKISKVSYEK